MFTRISHPLSTVKMQIRPRGRVQDSVNRPIVDPHPIKIAPASLFARAFVRVAMLPDEESGPDSARFITGAGVNRDRLKRRLLG
jgi:hypothetical protein